MAETKNVLVVNLRQMFLTKYECIVTDILETGFNLNLVASNECLWEKNWEWNFRIGFLKQF